MAEWVCDPGKPPAVFVCRGLMWVAPAVIAWWKTASGSSTISCALSDISPASVAFTRLPRPPARQPDKCSACGLDSAHAIPGRALVPLP